MCHSKIAMMTQNTVFGETRRQLTIPDPKAVIPDPTPI